MPKYMFMDWDFASNLSKNVRPFIRPPTLTPPRNLILTAYQVSRNTYVAQ